MSRRNTDPYKVTRKLFDSYWDRQKVKNARYHERMQSLEKRVRALEALAAELLGQHR